MFWAKTFKVYSDVKVLGFLRAKNMYSFYRFLYIKAVLIKSTVILVKREDIKNQVLVTICKQKQLNRCSMLDTSAQKEENIILHTKSIIEKKDMFGKQYHHHNTFYLLR